MLYTADILIPANTNKNKPVKQDIKVWRGVIHQVSMLFPTGCIGLVQAQLHEGSHPLWPSTDGQSLRGDGTFVIGKEFYEIKNTRGIITFRGWNADDTYAHTVSVGIWVLPKAVLLPAFAQEGIIGAMRSLFARGN